MITEPLSRIDLQCVSSGNPENYTYFWRHETKHMDVIRTFKSFRKSTLSVLPKSENTYSYIDEGIYVCIVSNSIPDFHGREQQEGKIELALKGIFW